MLYWPRSVLNVRERSKSILRKTAGHRTTQTTQKTQRTLRVRDNSPLEIPSFFRRCSAWSALFCGSLFGSDS
jgi:hypothetical protein